MPLVSSARPPLQRVVKQRLDRHAANVARLNVAGNLPNRQTRVVRPELNRRRYARVSVEQDGLVERPGDVPAVVALDVDVTAGVEAADGDGASELVDLVRRAEEVLVEEDLVHEAGDVAIAVQGDFLVEHHVRSCRDL